MMKLFNWLIITALVVTNLNYVNKNYPVTSGCNDCQVFWFISTNKENQEIWQCDIREHQARFTGFKLPGDALSPVLSPNSELLAYALITRTGKPQLEIRVLQKIGVNLQQVFTVGFSDFINVVDLHWISDEELGFISNANEQEYTIIDLHGKYTVYHANVPINSKSDDHLITYNPDFSYAAYIDFYNDRILFWNLLENKWVETGVVIPTSWVDTGRDFMWSPDGSEFLIMSNDLNWFAFSMQQNTFRQITDLGNIFRLRAPAISQKTDRMVFQIYQAELESFDKSIALWNQDTLIPTGLNVTDGQFLMNWHGWNENGRFFAFTVFDYIKNETQVFLFDSETLKLSVIYSKNEADARAVILGWTNKE